MTQSDLKCQLKLSDVYATGHKSIINSSTR